MSIIELSEIASKASTFPTEVRVEGDFGRAYDRSRSTGWDTPPDFWIEFDREGEVRAEQTLRKQVHEGVDRRAEQAHQLAQRYINGAELGREDVVAMLNCLTFLTVGRTLDKVELHPTRDAVEMSYDYYNTQPGREVREATGTVTISTSMTRAYRNQMYVQLRLAGDTVENPRANALAEVLKMQWGLDRPIVEVASKVEKA